MNVVGHPNIVRIFDINEAPVGLHYFVMEYLEGEPLSQLPRPLEPGLLPHLLSQACEALEAAHNAGVVHRDLKPDNLFVVRREGNPRPSLKVLDFGVAKARDSMNQPRLTAVGMVLGTPAYMAPEQWTGQPVDGRADIYALGVTAYLMATGRLPYPRGQVAESSCRPRRRGRYRRTCSTRAFRRGSRRPSCARWRGAPRSASLGRWTSSRPGVRHERRGADSGHAGAHARARAPAREHAGARSHRVPAGAPRAPEPRRAEVPAALGGARAPPQRSRRGGGAVHGAEPRWGLHVLLGALPAAVHPAGLHADVGWQARAVRGRGGPARGLGAGSTWSMPPGVGLQFINPSPELREYLRQLRPTRAVPGTPVPVSLDCVL